MLVIAGSVIFTVTMGINTAITGKNNIALVGNIVAQRAYRTAMFLGAAATKISTLAQAAYRGVLFLGAIAMKAITAAQLMFNAALTANPIGAVIVAISALVALVILAVNSYDDWGASLLLLMGPFGMIINIIQSFKRNWQMVKDAFTTGGLMSGLKAIGRVLIDSLLMPLQQLLELASNIPGLENLAGNAAIRISEMREGLNVNTGDESGVLPNSSQAASQETTETIRDSNVRIDVRDKGGNVEKVFQDGTAIPISMQNTVGVLNYGG